jgi:hypothetical protein
MHAYALAIDLAAVRDRAGVEWSVLNDWNRDGTDGGRWLHRFAETLYDRGVFNIVLTPDYNDDHKNHLHLDLKPGQRFFSRPHPWTPWVFFGVLLVAAIVAAWPKARARLRRGRGGVASRD